LIDSFSRNSALPEDRTKIYETGCLKLCSEVNSARRDARHIGDLIAEQRLVIASRIAAYSALAGKQFISNNLDVHVDPKTLDISEIYGGVEKVRGIDLQVLESAIRETLETALFTGRGLDQVGFAHRSYQEFLASRYIKQRDLETVQLESILFHPSGDKRVIPQLTEVAAWLASSDSKFAEKLIRSDPQVLLKSDVLDSQADFKGRILKSVIGLMQQGELDDTDWGLASHYKKLKFTGLADVLNPVILDQTQKFFVRRFAITVAEECKDSATTEALLKVVLDLKDDRRVRIPACEALFETGGNFDF
jgi:hypothetical protein